MDETKSMRAVKIEHAYPPAPPKNWFEKHQLLVMFILTAIGGGAISTAYQYFSHILVQERDGQIASINKDREIKAAQRKSAREFLLEFQDAAERRNYFAYRIVSNIEDILDTGKTPSYRKNAEERLALERPKYRDACEVWNIRRNYFERFLQLYVSEDARRRFFDKESENCITNQFLKIHRMQNELWSKYADGKSISPAEIEEFKDLRTKNAWDLAYIYDRLLEVSLESPPGTIQPREKP
jgi:hypothetical protein